MGIEDTATESPNAGYDVVIATGEGWFLGPNFEELRLSSNAEAYGHGNEGDNLIIGPENAVGRLYGGEGDDILRGGNSNDILDGEEGIDRMSGGRGNDTYFVDHFKDRIAEITGTAGGVDTVITSASYEPHAPRWCDQRSRQQHCKYHHGALRHKRPFRRRRK